MIFFKVLLLVLPFILIDANEILFLSFFPVKPDSLMDMMSFMKSDVGLVLQMPYCCTRKGFAAVYEKVCFENIHIPSEL